MSSEERLTAEDFDLFLPAMEDWQAANKTLQEAQQAFLEKRGALAYVFNRLRPKYALTDGDDVNLEGVIIRKV